MPDQRCAHVIQHIAFEDLGHFAPLLRQRGMNITTYPAMDSLPAQIPAQDILFVLGGPIGAYQDNQYPFLKQELQIIEGHVAAGGAVVGICLGAQLIARALGARVYPGQQEIGYAPVQLTEAGQQSCLAPLAAAPDTLHWHGDTFDLPSGSELLASTGACPHQAFT